MNTKTYYLSRQDAALKLAVSVRTIDRLCTEQDLIKVAVRGRKLIDAKSLDRLVSPTVPEERAPSVQDLFPIRELENKNDSGKNDERAV